jgi:hypothetical protein
MGIIALLARIFIHIPTEALCLPKAEIITGVILIFGPMAALLIMARGGGA